MTADDRERDAMQRFLLDIALGRHREVTAWCYAVTDLEFGKLVHVVGPFQDQYQALADSERARAEMTRLAEPDSPEQGWSYTVLPFWPPSEWKPG